MPFCLKTYPSRTRLLRQTTQIVKAASLDGDRIVVTVETFDIVPTLLSTPLSLLVGHTSPSEGLNAGLAVGTLLLKVNRSSLLVTMKDMMASTAQLVGRPKPYAFSDKGTPSCSGHADTRTEARTHKTTSRPFKPPSFALMALTPSC